MNIKNTNRLYEYYILYFIQREAVINELEHNINAQWDTKYKERGKWFENNSTSSNICFMELYKREW